MKFSAGYPVACSENFTKAVERHHAVMSEIYFAWPGMPSGRMPGRQGEEAEEGLFVNLKRFHSLGLRLNLLFNGNCHGGEAISLALKRRVTAIIEKIAVSCSLPDIITTTSPFVAQVVKWAFPQIDVRASVNMRIGTIESMECMSDLFDSFCVQREYNRKLAHLAELGAWAKSHGKKLTLLANSGCLNFCPNQVFHDNLVSHEAEILQQENDSGFNPVRCWSYLAKPEKRQAFITQGNWIRPEDVRLYERLGVELKLATRMHCNPGMVIGAYASGRHYGNLLDLLEPGMSKLFLPEILDNNAFPLDWLEKSLAGEPLPTAIFCRQRI